jgi:hypothetical protein
MTLQALLDANPHHCEDPGVIRVGDVILIPSLRPAPAASALALSAHGSGRMGAPPVLCATIPG